MNNFKIFLFAVLFLFTCKQSYSQTSEEGTASFYHDKSEGKKTASGEVYDMAKMTASHRTLPFNTQIKVTNLDNDQSVIVTINDRGPFHRNRILDLSKAAAMQLDYINKGTAKVKWELWQNE